MQTTDFSVSYFLSKEHLTVYYTVIEFYKDRRRAARKVFAETTLWDTARFSRLVGQKPPGFWIETCFTRFPGTQWWSCSEPPSSKLSITNRCWKVVPGILSEDKIWHQKSQTLSSPLTLVHCTQELILYWLKGTHSSVRCRLYCML